MLFRSYSKLKNVAYTHLVISKNDIHRIYEEINLPKAKPNIDSILYYNIRPLNIQTKVVEDGVRLMGDLNIFVLYTPENEERSLEYFETEAAFDEIINCNNCNEDMIPDIDVSVGSRELSGKPLLSQNIQGSAPHFQEYIKQKYSNPP